MSSQTGNLTCHNHITSEKMHEFDPGIEHVDLCDKTQKIGSQCSNDEQKIIGTLVASSVVDSMSGNSVIQLLGTSQCELGKSCLAGEGSCLQQCNVESVSGSLSNDKSTKICQPPAQVVRNESVENEPGKGSCLQQCNIKLVYGNLSLDKSEKICQPHSQDVVNELAEKRDTATSFHVNDLMQSVPAQVNSVNEQLVPPSGDVVNNISSECVDTKSKRAIHIRLGRKANKTPKRLKKKYMLRSLGGSGRALRSRSREKPKAPQPNSNLVNVDKDGANKRDGRKRRGRKKKERRGEMSDEFSRIRAHLRYLLNRVSYEQSLIDAYSGEGWKGQSLEKLKPEKELQRAKYEILRCKLKIREVFRHLDTLSADGRLGESLFDSEGEICSEDIFCAKCGSKDSTIDNDIILCDGACDRGFHQFCLEPPLLTENIPPGEEGWLCPGCDCKDDCIDLLNDSLGTSLSLSDTWEGVFPEAVATTGKNLDHNLGLPSDDSDDDNYNPDVAEDEEIRGGELKSDESESSSDESDSSSASEELKASTSDEMKARHNEDQYLGLPSDDSEDDDFDPNAPDLERKDMEESSSSDFTSDSEDLTAAIDVSQDQDPMFASLNVVKLSQGSGRLKCKVGKKQSLADELSSLTEPDPGPEGSNPVSGKRNVERLDYKKLYDETYPNVQSSGSDDEDWTETTTPGRRKTFTNSVDPVSPDENQIQKETAHTPRRNTRQKKVEGNGNSPIKSSEGSRSSTYRRLSEAVVQRLDKSFKQNRYPARDAKESLAQELGITLPQVSKWFENARWKCRHSSHLEASTGGNPLQQATCSRVENGEFLGGEDERKSELMSQESSGENPKTPSIRKRKHKSDPQASDTKPPAGSPIARKVQTGQKTKTRKKR